MASNTPVSDWPFLSSYFHSVALVHTADFSQSHRCNILLIRSPPCTEQLNFTGFSKMKVKLYFPSSLSSLVASSTYRDEIQILQVHLPVISLLLYFSTKARPIPSYVSLPEFHSHCSASVPLSSSSLALSLSSPPSAFKNYIQASRIGLNDTPFSVPLPLFIWFQCFIEHLLLPGYGIE